MTPWEVNGDGDELIWHLRWSAYHTEVGRAIKAKSKS
jgi:hypothetical protein